MPACSAGNYELYPLGEHGVVVQFLHADLAFAHGCVTGLCELLAREPFDGMAETVPAYTTLTVLYDPEQVYRMLVQHESDQMPFEWVLDQMNACIRRLTATTGSTSVKSRRIEIPVCYEEEYAPDLPDMARESGLSCEEVIRLHTEGDYSVYLLGFAPGFPYLGGLDERLHTPRRATPRLSVPGGSVGIGGVQTGVYPFSMPGGWQIIGRTPLRLFRPELDPPALLRAGDRLRFIRISQSEFVRMEAEI